MSTTIKKRHWWFVLYPESAVNDWVDKLTDRGLPFAVSPLHEFDVDDEGVLKKPHYHIILSYPGPTTFNNVKQLTVDELHGVIPKYIDNIRGAYDYLTHRNHPLKHQYNSEDIQLHNGFDLTQFIQMSEFDKADLCISILTDIKEFNITEYSKLLDYYVKISDYQKFNYCCSHTILMNGYLRSYKYSNGNEE